MAEHEADDAGLLQPAEVVEVERHEPGPSVPSHRSGADPARGQKVLEELLAGLGG